MELQGKIKLITDTKTYGDKGFKKREFVLTTKDQYPQDILIELHKDNCEKIDKFNVNEEVTVKININGREWTSPKGEVKHFNSIVGWSIEALNPLQDIPVTTDLF